MKAVWQLWLQPWRQATIPTLLGQLMWLFGVSLTILRYSGMPTLISGLSVIAMGTFFAHVAAGQTLRGLCRAESYLLPQFRQRLLATALFDLVQWGLLPGLLVYWIGLPHIALTTTALLGIGALGLSIGCGRRIGLLAWFVAIAAGWKPALAMQVIRLALDSTLTVPLLLLLIGWILLISVRPLLRIGDAEPASSPLESMSLGRMNALTDGSAQPRGAFGRRLASWFDITSQRALDAALARYRRTPSARQRLALIRSLLLPHDNPFAIALRLTLVALIVIMYFFAIQQRQQFNAAVIGAYATLLALSRFPQLGRGMLRMQPNLADLYLTLAPPTRADYQRTIADALLMLVPISVLTALIYTMLGIVMVHADEPGRMLLTALIITIAASLSALGIHLIGPTSALGRGMANFVVIFGAMTCYWGAYWVIGALGYAYGGGLTAAIALSFGVSVWFAARREYLRRSPCFDAPPS